MVIHVNWVCKGTYTRQALSWYYPDIKKEMVISIVGPPDNVWC